MRFVRTLRFATIAAVCLLGACAEQAGQVVATADSEPFAAATGVYHCAGPDAPFVLVTRTRPEGMSIFVPPSFGEQHRLLAEVVAGAHYAADGTEVILHDNAADLVLPEGHFPGCVYDRRASIWEHAKLNGVDFRAVGNEPGWVLEVRQMSTLWFNYDYGAGELWVPIVETRSDSEARRTIYTGRSATDELLVTLTGEECADTMADESYPTRVEIQLGERVFRGCGRPLH